MKVVNPIQIIKALRNIEPLLEAIAKAPDAGDNYSTNQEPKEIEMDGKKYYLVDCKVWFEKIDDAKQFIELDNKLDAFAKKVK